MYTVFLEKKDRILAFDSGPTSIMYMLSYIANYSQLIFLIFFLATFLLYCIRKWLLSKERWDEID